MSFQDRMPQGTEETVIATGYLLASGTCLGMGARCLQGWNPLGSIGSGFLTVKIVAFVSGAYCLCAGTVLGYEAYRACRPRSGVYSDASALRATQYDSEPYDWSILGEHAPQQGMR